MSSLITNQSSPSRVTGRNFCAKFSIEKTDRDENKENHWFSVQSYKNKRKNDKNDQKVSIGK